MHCVFAMIRDCNLLAKLHAMPKNAVNECSDKTVTCKAMAECINTPMYEYHCPGGFVHDINISIQHDADHALDCEGALIMAQENCAWKDKKITITAVTIPVGVAAIAIAGVIVALKRRKKS